MGKRKSAVLIESDDSRSSDSDSGSDIDKDMLSLAKKKGKGPSDKKVKVETFTSSSSSGSDSDSGSDTQSSKKGKTVSNKPGKRERRSASGTTQSSASVDDKYSDKEPTGAGSDAGSSSYPSPSRSLPVQPPTSSSIVSSSVNTDIKKIPSDLEEGEVSDDDLNPDEDDEEFWDGYDENMMGDAEDQRRLNAMTEKEREQEIFRRIEKRDLLRNRFETEKKLRIRKKLEVRLAKKGKKLDDLPYIDDLMSEEFQMDAKVRSQERKKTVEGKIDKKTQAMDALKNARDAKKKRDQEKEKFRAEQERKREDGDDDDLDFKKENDTSSSVGDKRMKKLKASDVYSDDSGSDYEDDRKSKDDKKSASDSDSRSGSDSEDDERNKKPQYVEKLEDLNRIRISRFKLEKWLYLPFFARVLKGCFVRVGIAGTGQKPTYRICEIDCLEGGSKVYQFGASRTDKVLKLDYATDIKKFRLEFVSNQGFTEEEFIKWKSQMLARKVALPTMDDIQKKEKEIKEAIEYQLQEEDIEEIIKEKAKFKSAPVNFAARKAQLMKEREMAHGNNEDEKATVLSKEIAELDERAMKLDKARTCTISSISYINERNRKKNVEEAEKAILEELKSTRGLKVEDPFTRRNTKPRIVSKSVVQNGFELGPGFHKAEPGTEDVKPVVTEINLTNNGAIDELDSKLNIQSMVKDEDMDFDASNNEQVGDLFTAHDFDIKLDLDAKLPPNLPIVARPSMAPMRDTAPRRSLNLEEYKRKKGLI